MSDPAHTKRGMSPRVLAAFVLIAVGGLGVVTGVALDRTVLRHHSVRGDSYRGRIPYWARTEGDHRRHWNRMAKRLHLSREQGTAIDSILAQQARLLRGAREDVDPRMLAIMSMTKQRIDSVLTHDQRVLLQELRRERERKRQRR
jgi:hypothetical protein